MLTVVINILLAIHVLVCVLLVFVVLLQRPRNWTPFIPRPTVTRAREGRKANPFQ